MRPPARSSDHRRERARDPKRVARAPRAVVLSALIAALVGLPGCGASTDQGAAGRTIRLDIPAGAGRLIDAGRDVPGVPEQIEGTVGDRFEIVNHDSETQVVSGFPVDAGQTLTIPLNRAGTYDVECSAHEDQSLTMVVSP